MVRNLNVGHHVVQFYGHDEELAERVAGYLLGALEGGGVAIVIATPEHRHAFGTRLAQAGVDLAAARDRGEYLVLDAGQTVRELMAADGQDRVGRAAQVDDARIAGVKPFPPPDVRVPPRLR